jgi:hypothetical protein
MSFSRLGKRRLLPTKDQTSIAALHIQPFCSSREFDSARPTRGEQLLSTSQLSVALPATRARLASASDQQALAPSPSRASFCNVLASAFGPGFVWLLAWSLICSVTPARADDAGAERYLSLCELQWMCARFGEAHAECDAAPDVDQCVGNKIEAKDRDEIYKCTNDGRVRSRPRDMPNRWQCFLMNFGKAIH